MKASDQIQVWKLFLRKLCKIRKFPNRPSEALFPKNLTGIFHRGGIDQSLINQFPPS